MRHASDDFSSMGFMRSSGKRMTGEDSSNRGEHMASKGISTRSFHGVSTHDASMRAWRSIRSASCARLDDITPTYVRLSKMYKTRIFEMYFVSPIHPSDAVDVFITMPELCIVHLVLLANRFHGIDVRFWDGDEQ